MSETASYDSEQIIADQESANSKECTGVYDSTRMYLNEISKYPLLSREQEVELAKAIEAGLVAEHELGLETALDLQTMEDLECVAREGRAAKELFINSNLRLVVSIAKRFPDTSLTFLDRVQEGNQALVRAVEKFDYTTGNKFSTFATTCIRNGILEAKSDRDVMIHVPKKNSGDVKIVRSVVAELTAALGRTPNAQEIADGYNSRGDKMIDAARAADLAVWAAQEPVSLDLTIDDDGENSLGSLVNVCRETPEDLTMKRARDAKVASLVARLNERERFIIGEMYGISTDDREPRVARVIAEQLGLSQTRVKQLGKLALEKLREICRNDELAELLLVET